MTARDRDRRAEILAGAAALFAEKGVATTTVRELADAAGILSGSLYHHFESKDHIVEEIVISYVDDLRRGYDRALAEEQEPRARLVNLIRVSLEVAERHHGATEIYLNELQSLRSLPRYGTIRRARSAMRKAWIATIESGIQAGAFRSDLDPQVVYRLIREAVWRSVRWYRPTAAYPVERFASDCASIFLDGLTTPGPRVS
ncbi:MAG: TetR family transcriptional regulator [Micromonosporaceae bacterium]|nr:TetR family transcriptional regulator [Micromonosporaceae bacterium]